MDNSSGVGVVDKVVLLINSLVSSPLSLQELSQASGLPRPTAHRLAVALEHHRVIARNDRGQFILGPQLAEWSTPQATWVSAAATIARELRDATGVSAQVYRRVGDERVCVAASEPVRGLRDTVPVGALLTMKAGSAAQVLTAWTEAEEQHEALDEAAFTAKDLIQVRTRGWAASVAQREPGVASLSAPVRDATGTVIAAISISGPVDPLAQATKAQITALLAAANQLEAAIAN